MMPTRGFPFQRAWMVWVAFCTWSYNSSMRRASPGGWMATAECGCVREYPRAGRSTREGSGMAVNLTPQYHEAEEEYKGAQTAEERLECLQKMWQLVPKHKASEKLQAELKTKISET